MYGKELLSLVKVARSWQITMRTICGSSFPKAHNRRSFPAQCSREITDYCRRHNQFLILRSKHTKKQSKRAQEELDADDDDEEDDDIGDYSNGKDGSKVISSNVNSLRLDLVLKAGLGLARNKIETAFYESKVRLNGKVVPKKSTQVRIGDEIDLIRGKSAKNPLFITVSRVVVLSAKAQEDGVKVRLSRDKNLLIDNYEENPWHGDATNGEQK